MLYVYTNLGLGSFGRLPVMGLVGRTGDMHLCIWLGICILATYLDSVRYLDHIIERTLRPVCRHLLRSFRCLMHL